MLKRPSCQSWLKKTGLIVGTLWFAATVPAEARKTYYIDPAIGDNAFPGTDPAKPWKTLDKIDSSSASNVTYLPGDSILLKAGSTFSGQIWPMGTGTPAAPIVIDRYGIGANPIINGNLTSIQTPGSTGKANGKDNGATVLLKNIQGYEVNNLVITNKNGMGGIKIIAGNPGTWAHYHFKNLVIHDINGSRGQVMTQFFGGILIKQGGPEAQFDDILIDGCEIHDIGWIGIQCGYHDFSVDVKKRFSGFIIRNSKVYDCGQSGIILRNVDNALIENTVFHDNGRAKYFEAFGIRLKFSKGSIIQKCEAYGNSDDGSHGQGFALDGTAVDCILQYNYSHDNAGGFAAVISDPGEISSGNIIRYNISQNDRGRSFLLEDSRNVSIYNNTVYVAKGISLSKVLESNAGSGNSLRNNLFFIDNGAGYDFGSQLDYNGYFGVNVVYPDDVHKLSANPLFTMAGVAGNGISSTGGYLLQPSSPALQAGIIISGNGGFDFWGNAIPGTGQPNLGAYSGRGDGMVSNLYLHRAEIKKSGPGRGQAAVHGFRSTNGRVIRNATSRVAAFLP